MQRVTVGTSGWNYDHWRGVFYPDGLARSRWLGHYAGVFSSVEVNATFYRSMRPSTFEAWRSNTPGGFVWSLKANRFITHVRRLRDCREPLERFLGSVAVLGEKLGPVLFQLPPSLAFDGRTAMEFFALRPEGALWSIEARHASWTGDEALACLRQAGVAWCISDTAGRYPFLEAVTAPFVYIRLHGSRRLYASCYTEDELRERASRIRGCGCDAYVYFDNDHMGYAPANALLLMDLLEGSKGVCVARPARYNEP